MATLKSLVSQLMIYWTHHATRRDLSRRLHEMNSKELEALIRDIGIPKSAIIQEVSRPFWSAAPFQWAEAKTVQTHPKYSWSQAFKMLARFGA